jgi:hypothetical protein
LTPTVVVGLTSTRALKTLSPAVTSPFVPSSRSKIDGRPPIELALAVTMMFVLGGPSAGVTVTVNSVEVPAGTVDGDAPPTPLRFAAKLGGAAARNTPKTTHAATSTFKPR